MDLRNLENDSIANLIFFFLSNLFNETKNVCVVNLLSYLLNSGITSNFSKSIAG